MRVVRLFLVMAATFPLLLLLCRASLSLSAPLQPTNVRKDVDTNYNRQPISYNPRLAERQENTTSPSGLQACATSFCPEAIANVAAVVTAVVVLIVLACILWHYQVQQERVDRIRQAMARNAALDKHLETTSARKQHQRAREGEEMLLTSPSSGSVAKHAAATTTTDSETVQAEVHQQ